MGRSPIGDRPATDAERQAKRRTVVSAQRMLAGDMASFLLALTTETGLSHGQRKQLTDLQHRIRALHPI